MLRTILVLLSRTSTVEVLSDAVQENELGRFEVVMTLMSAYAGAWISLSAAAQNCHGKLLQAPV